MRFTDVFIHRPVLASVVSLLILLVGLRSLTVMELRQYPESEDTVVTVTTPYPGADSEVVKGFITTPLQQAIAEAEGIDYLFARSTHGLSTIEAHMELNYDPNDAIAEIQAKVASERNRLPEGSEDPVITSTTGEATALMYLAFFSDEMTPPQINDYLLRVVQPKLQAVPGVAKARLIGNQTFAMRIWLDPQRMAALGVTALDVAEALRANNFLASIGESEGEYVAINLRATTDASDVEDFERLVVRETEDTLIRLRDVASPELGAEDTDSASWYKGETAVFVGIEPTPGANPLTVAERVHARLTEVRAQLPEGLQLAIPYDASVYIDDSIREVFRTLGEAVLIVLAVIFVSLGSLRAALVPAVAVPLSLIGGAFLMLLLGFSINLLTLLALVLAIGLVVDDAIVVVENVHRHIRDGQAAKPAALAAARELALPIIAMTTTLVAVYAPIGFMGGLVGTLFTEFAFTLAGAVLVSGVVALTLSPMLSAAVLRSGEPGRFEAGVERFFDGLARRYQHLLHRSLDFRPVTYLASAVILVSIYFMFTTSQSELAPTEDQSILFFQATGPQTATLEYNETFSRQIIAAMETIPEYQESFLLMGFGGDASQVFGGFRLPPPAQRERSQMAVQPELQTVLAQVAGFQTAVFPRSALPGAGGGLPVQFVITSDADYEELSEIAAELQQRAMASGNFRFLRRSVEIDQPQTTVVVDRDRAADLGLTMAEIGRSLGTFLGGGYINRFSLEGRSYRVIPQVDQRFRLRPEQIEDYYLENDAGELVPLAAVVHLEQTVEPSARTQFQQLNSITLGGITAAPRVTLGDALAYLEGEAEALFPRGYSVDYKGESRQFVQQGSALLVTFFLALLVIYLVLAAQFESWRDPMIILVSVPLSIAGALAFITLGLATINIYTQVGLITLIGLIAKNGILIVEFANQIQLREGLDRRAAVEQAAAIRLRPILMTTLAMIMAMVPLLLATGPGAVSRFHIGLTIATGLAIGTLFTLFVVPAVYVALARARAPADEETRATSPTPAAGEQA